MTPIPSSWRPLSTLYTQPHGATVYVLDTSGNAWRITVQHGPVRKHGVTLQTELPPCAVLWRPA